MKIYKGELKCIQFKDINSYNRIMDIFKRPDKKTEEDYKHACKFGIRVNHITRLFPEDYLCEHIPNEFIKLDSDFMKNFKKG